MALTKAQKEAIQRQQKKNIADRAAAQAKKISDMEARSVSASMKKGSAPNYRRQTPTRTLLTKSETEANAKSNRENAAKEKSMQKQRKFAKGEGKLPTKERVGTKAEYKQLGKEIKIRKDLIAAAKKAKAAQAERKANPAKAPAQTSGTAKVTDRRNANEKALSKKAAAKEVKKNTPKGSAKVTDSPKSKSVKAKVKAATLKAPKMGKADIAKFESNIDKLVAEQKAATPKASTAAIKKRTVPNTKATQTTAPKLKTLEEAKASAPKPKTKAIGTTKLQTLDEAKSKAPKPKGPSATAPEAPKVTEAAKPKGKVAGVTGAAKKAVGSTKTAKTIKAASQTSAAKKVAASKPAKLLKGAGKVAKVGFRIGQFVGAGKEVGQVLSGQAEKDFRRIQALENKIAVAKGQKPKYTTTGSNKNLLSSVKTDLGVATNILTAGMAGKTRKDRLKELQGMLAKTQKKAANKPNIKVPKNGMSPSDIKNNKGATGGKTTTGSNYRVVTGDTLSGIASRAGVSLTQLRAANPKITDPKKIFNNTKVVIPKGGKVPTGGYTPKKKVK